MTSFKFATTFAIGMLVASAVPAQPDKPAPKSANGVATALWFAHLCGAPSELTPAKDRQLKGRLAAAPEWARKSAGELFDVDTFRRFAGEGTTIPLATMERILQEKSPKSRAEMFPKTRQHLDLLTTQFDMIDEDHRKPAEELVAWVVKNYQPGKPLGVVAVCTKNTRRSVLTASMGNLAASYYGLTDLRFHSGGTDPDAVNPRTLTALKEIGIEVEATGREAKRGKANEPNPVHRLRWGKELEAEEFSKNYADPANPKAGFAALMVCGEADEACPMVKGAGVRIPVPYLDPKAFDGAPFEAAKYAERRDDIGRFMLSVAMQARRRLELEVK